MGSLTRPGLKVFFAVLSRVMENISYRLHCFLVILKLTHNVLWFFIQMTYNKVLCLYLCQADLCQTYEGVNNAQYSWVLLVHNDPGRFLVFRQLRLEKA